LYIFVFWILMRSGRSREDREKLTKFERSGCRRKSAPNNLGR
jgi:hypothetical protein